MATNHSGDPGRPRPRFGRSGHASFDRKPPAAPEEQFDAPTYYVPRTADEPETERLPHIGDEAAADHPTADHPTAAHPAAQTSQLPAGAAPGAGDTSPQPPPAGAPKLSVTRAVAGRGNQAARYVTNKVVAASRADGASESGLTRLIWNQVLSYGADAMITVALAGTVFFSAAKSDQRGNVLEYLLITMAPFAVVAPVIGPVLDRFQHGRRIAMATSAFGRALLAILMAQHFNNLFALFPLALGSLVLSKAYSVVRAAAAPRLVPQGMSLVTANARLSLFGLGAMLVGGGFIGAVIKLSGSYWLGLWITAIPFVVNGVFSLRLPKQVDSTAPAARHPGEPPRPREVRKVPPLTRIVDWAGRGYGNEVLTALSGASLLRWTTGFLTMFLAFWVQSESHGLDAAGRLGAIGAGLGIGNAVGTAIGARLKLGHSDRLVVFCAALASVACIGATALFGIGAAVACTFLVGGANSLGKVALDAIIQRDVGETLRSSAFARSETFLQLSWVIGATVAILLPLQHGMLGMGVAAAFTAVAAAAIVLRARAQPHGATTQQIRPGTV